MNIIGVPKSLQKMCEISGKECPEPWLIMTLGTSEVLKEFLDKLYDPQHRSEELENKLFAEFDMMQGLNTAFKDQPSYLLQTQEADHVFLHPDLVAVITSHHLSMAKWSKDYQPTLEQIGVDMEAQRKALHVKLYQETGATLRIQKVFFEPTGKIVPGEIPKQQGVPVWVMADSASILRRTESPVKYTSEQIEQFAEILQSK